MFLNTTVPSFTWVCNLNDIFSLDFSISHHVQAMSMSCKFFSITAFKIWPLLSIDIAKMFFQAYTSWLLYYPFPVLFLAKVILPNSDFIKTISKIILLAQYFDHITIFLNLSINFPSFFHIKYKIFLSSLQFPRLITILPIIGLSLLKMDSVGQQCQPVPWYYIFK